MSESLNLFPAMSVRENLQVGANSIRDKAQVAATMELVFQLFPRLLERREQLAGTLSGGERKMLAIGRGLMSGPSLLLVDEPSLGLAPMATIATFEALKALRERGVTILLVEQNVNTTLRLVRPSLRARAGPDRPGGNRPGALDQPPRPGRVPGNLRPR